MSRPLHITRDEAEWLVDLLEDCDPKKTGSWRFDLASQARELFGMVPGGQDAEAVCLDAVEILDRCPDKSNAEFLARACNHPDEIYNP